MSDWYEQAITYGIEQGWIDRSGSSHRLNGLKEVHKAMPKEAQAALPPLIIFSPSLGTGGLVLLRELPPGFAFVYLSPTLEHEFHINTTWAVAHEFVHLALGHGHYRKRNAAEVAADEKAASDLADTWVRKSNPENSRFERLLNMGKEALKLELEKLQNPEL
jgi:hypothetical protein